MAPGFPAPNSVALPAQQVVVPSRPVASGTPKVLVLVELTFSLDGGDCQRIS